MKLLAVLSLLIFFVSSLSAEAACTFKKTDNEFFEVQTEFGQFQIHYSNNKTNFVFPLQIENIGFGAYCKKLTLIPESNLLLVEFFNGGTGSTILSVTTSLIIISYNSERMEKVHELSLSETITNSTSTETLYQWSYEFNTKSQSVRLFNPKSGEQKTIQITFTISNKNKDVIIEDGDYESQDYEDFVGDRKTWCRVSNNNPDEFRETEQCFGATFGGRDISSSVEEWETLLSLYNIKSNSSERELSEQQRRIKLITTPTNNEQNSFHTFVMPSMNHRSKPFSKYNLIYISKHVAKNSQLEFEGYQSDIAIILALLNDGNEDQQMDKESVRTFLLKLAKFWWAPNSWWFSGDATLGISLKDQMKEIRSDLMLLYPERFE